MNAYLRWIEIQRTGPPHNQNALWETLQKQWIASLRGQGFTEEEIINDFKEWKAQTPFEIGRPAMTEALIHNVFETGFPAAKKPELHPENSTIKGGNSLKRNAPSWDQHDGDGENKRPKHFSSMDTQIPIEYVPYNYVCKRCNVKGHLLWNCPTNLDPKYDSRPSNDYSCKGCGQSGLHYFTLCPNNPDPQSIYQLRVAEKEREKERSLEYEKERKRRIDETFGPSLPSRFKPQKIERLKFEDGNIADEEDNDEESMMKFDSKNSSDTFDFSFDYKKTDSSNDNNINLKKFEEIKQDSRPDSQPVSYNQKRLFPFLARKPAVSESTEQSRIDKEALPQNMEESEGARQLDTRGFDESNSQKKPHPRNPLGQQWIRPGVPHPIRLSLLSKEVVNKRVKRPTALEMWDRDDEERKQRRLQAEVLLAGLEESRDTTQVKNMQTKLDC